MIAAIFQSSMRRIQALLALAWLASLTILLRGPSARDAWAKIQTLTASNADAKIPWELDVNVGIQAAAALNSILLLILMLTARWWLRPWKAEPASGAVRTSAKLGKGVIVGLLGIVVLGTALRVPLASKSLWWDELWSIRQCSHGSWKADDKAEDPEALKFSPTSWKRCAFYYQKPTNHVPLSLLQKTSLDLWRWLTGAPRHEFSDLAARLPALALSAGAILLTGWLLLSWGAGPVAALAGALLLAVHPMAIRYGVDARGYALVMPLALSSLLACTRLLRLAGRDGVGWIWLAINQCLWLWAFPHGLLDVAVMTLFLGVLLVKSQTNASDRVAVSLRLIVAHVCSGLLFIQLFLPCVLQARHWAGQEGQGHTLDAVILKDTVTRVLTGVRWREPTAGTDFGVGLPQLETLWGSPMSGIVLIVLTVTLLLWNVVQACRRDTSAPYLIAGLLFSGMAFAFSTWAVGTYYYSRFAIALVPVVVIGLALGWGLKTRWMKGVQAGVWIALLMTAVRGSEVLLTNPIEPIRDVATWLENQGGEKAKVLGYGHGREALAVFVPRLLPVDDAAQIQQALANAKTAGTPVYLVLGHFHFNRSMLPTGFPMIEDTALFTEEARFNGVESENHYRIYRAQLQ
jgi:hypothetical protein